MQLMDDLINSYGIATQSSSGGSYEPQRWKSFGILQILALVDSLVPAEIIY